MTIRRLSDEFDCVGHERRAVSADAVSRSPTSVRCAINTGNRIGWLLVLTCAIAVSAGKVSAEAARSSTPPRLTGANPQAIEAGADLSTSPVSIAGFNQPELVLGSPLASTTVIEYLSVTCSHCAAFARDTWPAVDRRYVQTGAVRFIVREMPTAPVAVAAAGFLLARCTGPQRYWSVVQALLAHQGEVLGASTLSSAIEREAALAGLDPEMAKSCLSDADAIDAINARRQSGLDAGIDSTPYFLINGRPLLAGTRLAGETYDGGELSLAQFIAALRRATPSAISQGHVERPALRPR